MKIYFAQIILIISNYSNIVTSAVQPDKMAENRSKSQEAATLLRRAASILTQNSAESEGCCACKEQQYAWSINTVSPNVQLNSTCLKSASYNL
jgi:hypothetical protein